MCLRKAGFIKSSPEPCAPFSEARSPLTVRCIIAPANAGPDIAFC
jgi:hypothetical protein